MPAAVKTRAVSGVESGRKLLRVLMCFTGAEPSWSVAEIAAKLELTTSTAYRYVGLLKDEGFLQVSSDSTYRVTARALALAEAYTADKADPVAIAMPVMTRLRDEVGETILLARRVGDFAFCIDRVESLQSVRLQFDKGQAMSLHKGSMARLLLSYMPAADRRRYLEKVDALIASERRHLLTDEALDGVAEAGLAVSMEEVDPHIWGCAAVIHRRGEDELVIGTAGPLYRLDEASRERATGLISDAAAEITDLLRQGEVTGR